jgi:hypothetical protein
MHLISKSPKWVEKYLPLILWANFILIMYLPLLMNGGIIIDDWGGVAHNIHCESIFHACFIDQYRSTFVSVFTNRPLAALPIVVSTVLFKTNFTWYLYLNTTLLLLSILITASVVKRISGTIAAIIFSYVASIPFISMPLVVSPINLMDSTQAYLFWAISLFLLYSYCQKKSVLAYVISYLLLVCGFFTYEVFLPLLTMNALIPWIVCGKEYQHKKLKYIFEFIAPLIAVLAVVFLWQKVIGPHYYEIPSRLNFVWDSVIPSFLSWAGIFFSDIPSLFFNARKFLSGYLIFGSTVFILSIVISWRIISVNQVISREKAKLYLLASTICLLSTSFILILSSTKATIGGYEARALSSTWFGFAFFCSALSSFIAIQKNSLFKKIIVTISLAIMFFCALSFGIQRDNYIKSWELQMYLVHDALQLLSREDVSPGALVIGNVPAYLEKNYNNELVFDTPWDFGSALRIFSNSKVDGGFVVDAKNKNFHNLKIADGTLSMDYVEKLDNYSNLWFYDYSSSTKKGSLIKINSAHELKTKLAFLGLPFELVNKEISSTIKLGDKINFSYDWQNRGSYIKNGFAEREGWGVWSSGNEAELVLPLPVNGAKFLDLNVRAFVSKTHPMQRIEVVVDDAKKYQYTFSSFEGNLLRIPMPVSMPGEEKLVKLRFHFSDAISPKQLGIGPDVRELAIGFESATFQ